jgi:hypothetical protein
LIYLRLFAKSAGEVFCPAWYDFLRRKYITTLSLTHMQYVMETPSALKQEKHEIVEIKLWGLYLLINPNNLYSEMIDASLDRGPVEKNPQKPGRITFRFSVGTWESKIKKLLYSYRIPVIVNDPMNQALGSGSSSASRMMA